MAMMTSPRLLVEPNGGVGATDEVAVGGAGGGAVETVSSMASLRSCSGYHRGLPSSRAMSPMGRQSSPRKSLRPNVSECQTESHRVRDTMLLRLTGN